MTFFGTTEHFSGRIGALRWSILWGNKSIMYKSLRGRPFHSWGGGGGDFEKKFPGSTC